MIYWILATLTAFFIKGLCGFANTLVFTSILSFGIVNANISPVELLIGYPSNLILVWKKRTSLHPRIFFLPMLFVLAGSIPGAFILKYINANIVKIIFGIVVIGIGIQMWFQQKGAKNEETEKSLSSIHRNSRTLRRITQRAVWCRRSAGRLYDKRL